MLLRRSKRMLWNQLCCDIGYQNYRILTFLNQQFSHSLGSRFALHTTSVGLIQSRFQESRVRSGQRLRSFQHVIPPWKKYESRKEPTLYPPPLYTLESLLVTHTVEVAIREQPESAVLDEKSGARSSSSIHNVSRRRSCLSQTSNCLTTLLEGAKLFTSAVLEKYIVLLYW